MRTHFLSPLLLASAFVFGGCSSDAAPTPPPSAPAQVHASGRSAGCGKTSEELPSAWSPHDLSVNVAAQFATSYGARRYFTRPPKTYDSTQAYPVTIWGNGCGTSSAENTPLSAGPAAQASIQVQVLGINGCFSAGPDGDNADSPELPYFDAVLADVEQNYCVDESKVYLAGFSSGGWFTSLMACARSNVLRGVGWLAAGEQFNRPACQGPMAAILARGVDDAKTPLDQTEAAREDLRVRNGCSETTAPWDPDEAAFSSSPCVAYQGCRADSPLVWCPIPGGHTDGTATGLSSVGFWKFWSDLPPL
jgi:poly(3-hydroxybutyrate) depolymerase